MIYIYRVRCLVKIVMNEIEHSTDLIETDPRYTPNVSHCLHVFQDLSPKRYTDSVARKTLAIATGKRHYLGIDDRTEHASSLRQKLNITDEGLILLTPSGYISALAKSIDASLLISVLALLVSVLVAVFKR